MKRAQIVASIAAALAACQVIAAMVAGAELKEWAPNPKRHTIAITREAEDDVGRKMIESAEKARPESGAWWVVKGGEPVITCGLKTPHAITSGALDYYIGKIKGYQQKSWRWYTEPRSSLVYTASVVREASVTVGKRELKDVYVVTMKLQMSFAHVEEPAGGVAMTKTRTVILDEGGVSQSIAGDGDERFPMWMM